MHTTFKRIGWFAYAAINIGSVLSIKTLTFLMFDQTYLLTKRFTTLSKPLHPQILKEQKIIYLITSTNGCQTWNQFGGTRPLPYGPHIRVTMGKRSAIKCNSIPYLKPLAFILIKFVQSQWTRRTLKAGAYYSVYSPFTYCRTLIVKQCRWQEQTPINISCAVCLCWLVNKQFVKERFLIMCTILY